MLWRSCSLDGAVTAICVDDRGPRGSEVADAAPLVRVVDAVPVLSCCNLTSAWRVAASGRRDVGGQVLRLPVAGDGGAVRPHRRVCASLPLLSLGVRTCQLLMIHSACCAPCWNISQNVALNASAVAVVGDELVVGTRDGRILVYGSDDVAVRISGTGYVVYRSTSHL